MQISKASVFDLFGVRMTWNVHAGFYADVILAVVSVILYICSQRHISVCSMLCFQSCWQLPLSSGLRETGSSRIKVNRKN